MYCRCQCQSQSGFVNVTKIAKLFRIRSPRKLKTAGKRIVISISQEMTSEKEISLEVDGRQTENGKT